MTDLPPEEESGPLDEPIVPPIQNVTTLEIVNTVVRTLNDVIAALRDEISELGAAEKRGRTRLAGMLIVLMIAAVASVVGLNMNYQQGDDVKAIVSYIEDCQKPDSECKKRNDAVVAGAVTAISGAIFDANVCVQRVPLAQRTDEKITECRVEHIGKPKK